ncbi:MAG: peptidoglycan-binding protein [Ignavibacteria bacterium]|nr:peptidoglycan-binding protein [Ignavibacteria bacterium]
MKVLKKGSKGTEVKTLQGYLKQLGYEIDIDGIFGNDTKKTVIQFQTDNNLSPDGAVGPNTWGKLNELIGSTTIYGVDVSHHNGIINWSNVNRNQAKFVICKATQGKTFKDGLFNINMNQLAALNYIRGAYHFFTFKGVTADEQVDNFLGCNIDFQIPGMLPPVVDVELQGSESSDNYVFNNRSACANKLKSWLVSIENQTGRRPVIYTAKGFWNGYLGAPSGFETYDLWVASYRNDRPTMPGTWPKYLMWQYTEGGHVSGIQGNVDRNIFNGSEKALKTLALL